MPAAALAGPADFDRVDPGELGQRRHVAMVYADQNLRSPASMFGHTFLVFHDEFPPESDAPVVEFLGDANAFAAEVKAVFLRIPGRFRLSRFVFMQRAYDLEDRTLFAYVLKLAPSEKERLTRLASEALRETWQYDFFRDNCSYQMLALLLRSLDPGPGFADFPFVLPASTIRFLERNGRIERSFPLPSSLRTLDESHRQLSPVQRAEFEAIVAGVKTPGPATDPAVAASVGAFVRYRAPREADPGRRNALFQSLAELARNSPGEPHPAAARAALRDPGQTRASVIGVGWRAADAGLATLTVLPAVRGFENTEKDGLRNSALEIARLRLFFRPGRFGVYQFRAVHLDAQQAGSPFGDGFTRYLDASFEKSPNKDWSLHDEYRVHFGGGATVGRGALSASAVILTGPRYAIFAGQRAFLWDVGVKASIHLWLGEALHVRSQFQWIPLAPGNDQGLWSNLAALAVGPVSVVGGVESPGGNPFNVHALGAVNFAF